MQGRYFAAVEGMGPYFGKIYFFNGPSYYRYTIGSPDGMDVHYPKPVAAWCNPPLPAEFQSGVDAVLNGRKDYAGKAYFFKGNRYARYDWNNDRYDFTNPLSAWNKLPADFYNGIDCAFNGMFNYSDYAYFFKGNRYARYDWGNDVCDYTGLISAWNLPLDFQQGLDAAVNAPANYVGAGKYLGYAWFFKGRQYVRYNWTSNSIDYRATLLAWDFQKERQAIIDKAREKMADPPIHALSLGPDGLRVGWQKLQEIFQLVAPDIVAGDGLERRVKHSTKVNNDNDAIPDWCGIYDLWATKAAGRNVGNWVYGDGLNKVTGFRKLPAEFTLLDVGDVVVRTPAHFNHHALVTGIPARGTVNLISGNWAPTANTADSTIGEEQNQPISEYSAGWFTAFPP